ncbi:ABC transporter substrate-binding protein [Devosia sp. XJ19-1]|uniref:ABC transporter substrate-binding protein n=1 Tax=Devosia ureilytica TaxID=2952754 RepID=A0A9Q4FRU4_9HYPH|nr:ABC transporter substrate-binding protein [Devosia ureilytica]MCP8881935.1 ABC transporter substrate-binding protein [Devosia ureilytica]MCP8886179.1 ABC transporter substrate-binding protein [Devosia ureilytica]
MTLALGLTTAIAPLPAYAGPDDGGSLVVASIGVARHFNGAIQSGVATALPSTQLFASPLQYTEDWTPEPYLAKSWDVSEDGLTVTLNLVDNAKFHDGVPLTSEDVKFSIETIKANHPFQTMLAPVSSVDTPDATTVVIHLEHPHPALLLAMSPALMPIIPKHVYGEGDIQTNPANMAPIGSGPFKFGEYVQGEYLRLDKNPDFFIEGLPYLDEIYIQSFADPNTLMLAFERGDVDMIPGLSSPRDTKRLSEMDGVTIDRETGEAIGAINWLAFNTKKPPLDNVLVRQAIAYAIDRDFITNTLLQGFASPDFGPIVPTSPLATDDVEKFDVDLEKAASLLDEAGMVPGADGSRFTLSVDLTQGNEEMGRNIAEYLRSQLKQVGITIELRATPDFPTWAQRVSTYDYDLTLDQVYNWGDPVIGVNRTYLTSNIRPGVIWSNTQQYSNPRVDELLLEAAKENDLEKRKALYAEFQQIVVSDVPIYFLNVVPVSTAHKSELGGVPSSIWGVYSPLSEVYWQ